ncbi:MAG: aldo/keto reductase [Clostridia bacterium]|nr:aldo/keto reductase [Clostridia bacterium]
MIYKQFKDKKLSALGMGTMRLPTNDDGIDMQKAGEIVDYAIKNGVNYFDTAWGYHGGRSETALGTLLSAYPRDSFYLATKFPSYDVSNFGKAEEIFEKQLEKCKVDYFDFYLFHNVCEANIENYLKEPLDTKNYFCEQKKNGRITHLGASFHGSIETMKRFLDVYSDCLEFGMIQLNYLDWTFQNAKGKVELFKSYGIPVWVMEPVRGGRLATLSPEMTEQLKALRPEETVPGWAFRFIQSIPEVVVTLSGMSDLEQIKQNVRTFEENKPLSDSEMVKLLEIVEQMLEKKTVPCTTCRYCVDYCPQKLDIPKLLRLYNEYSFSGGGFLAPMNINAMPPEKRPHACIGCKSCESVCPQQIAISEIFKEFSSKL